MKQQLTILLLMLSTAVFAADISITPDSSLADAVRRAREIRRLGQAPEGVTILLSPGTYRLYEPLRLRPEDSGLTIEGRNAIVSGGVRVSDWRREGRLWVADVPEFNGRPLDFRQLWVNGRKAVRARDVQDFEQMSRIINVDKQRQVIWIPAKTVGKLTARNAGKKAAGSQIAPLAEPAEMVLHQMWAVGNLRIRSVEVHGDSAAVSFHNPESRLQFSRPWPSPMYNSEHNSPYYIYAHAYLDAPGEWWYDVREGKLYYMPRKGEELETVEAVVPAIETVIEVVGTAERPVRNVTFRGIEFAHTTWMRPSLQGHVPLQAGMYLTEAYKLRPQIDRENNHKLDNQGWLGRADAAVEVRFGEGIDFKECSFRHLGGSGLDYVVGCKGGTTSRCTFEDIAMNGYVCGSFSPEGLETHLPYAPDFREVCRSQAVSNCLFTDVTNEDWGCVAVAAGYVADINIEHNTIHGVSYSGISLGWGWNRDLGCMKDNRVYANLVYDYARHMYDCAGIYTLGNQPGTVISENVVRDIARPSYVHDPNHWFYLYTDEGSSNITLRDNWTPEEKFLKNAVGPGNIWENNGPMVSDEIKRRAGVEPR
ncbi:MAG: right-handed parallel beta-helix repeat-containing protein [Prevotella sp.]|nr:right-handed parallel beta-helix repeat-containing protein [Prevotella sp.]